MTGFSGVFRKTIRFFRNCYFGCGFNRKYCDLVAGFLQSAFRWRYLRCGTNRLCLENSQRVRSALIYILASLWVYYLMLDILLRYFTSVSFLRAPSVFTVYIYFSALYVTSRVVHVLILLPGALVWLLRGVSKVTCKTLVIGGWSSPFFS